MVNMNYKSVKLPFKQEEDSNYNKSNTAYKCIDLLLKER